MAEQSVARKPQKSPDFCSPEKSIFSRVWNFLWNDNSIWSWIISLVLAFIIVKFILFPGMSLILSTPLPLVVIESSSMHHSGSLIMGLTGFAVTDEDSVQFWYNNSVWYEDNNISLGEIEKWRFNTGLDKGDIIMVYGTKASKLKVGDVIIFDAGQRNPIIHRVVGIKQDNGNINFSTKGDNNAGQLTFETSIPSDAVLGKAVVRVPKIGWVKLVFVEIVRAFS